MFGWFKKQKPLDIKEVVRKIESKNHVTVVKVKKSLFYGLQGIRMENVKVDSFIILNVIYDGSMSWMRVNIKIINKSKCSEIALSLNEVVNDQRISFDFNN